MGSEALLLMKSIYFMKNVRQKIRVSGNERRILHTVVISAGKQETTVYIRVPNYYWEQELMNLFSFFPNLGNVP